MSSRGKQKRKRAAKRKQVVDSMTETAERIQAAADAAALP